MVRRRAPTPAVLTQNYIRDTILERSHDNIFLFNPFSSLNGPSRHLNTSANTALAAATAILTLDVRDTVQAYAYDPEIHICPINPLDLHKNTPPFERLLGAIGKADAERRYR